MPLDSQHHSHPIQNPPQIPIKAIQIPSQCHTILTIHINGILKILNTPKQIAIPLDNKVVL